MPESKPESRPFQCRHIFPDGHRCGSKCLRHEPFCYYHHTARAPKPRELRDTLSFFDMPLIDDRSSIHAAIGLILHRLAAGCLDAKRAGLFLYGLQIAAANLPPYIRNAPRPDSVTDIVDDPTHGPIAAESRQPKPFSETLEEAIAARLAQAGLTPQPATREPDLPLTAVPDVPLPNHASTPPQAIPTPTPTRTRTPTPTPTPHTERAEGPSHPSLRRSPRDESATNQSAEGAIHPSRLEATEPPSHHALSSQLTAASSSQLRNHALPGSSAVHAPRFDAQLLEDSPDLKPFREALKGPDGRAVAAYCGIPYPEDPQPVVLPSLKAYVAPNEKGPGHRCPRPHLPFNPFTGWDTHTAAGKDNTPAAGSTPDTRDKRAALEVDPRPARHRKPAAASPARRPSPPGYRPPYGTSQSTPPG